MSEYIWDGTHLQGAGDADDYNHEGIIMANIALTYGEEFYRALKKVAEAPEDSPIHDKLELLGYDNYSVGKIASKLRTEEPFYEDVKEAYDILHGLYPEEYSHPDVAEAMAALNGDARKYGAKHFGYVIIRNDGEVIELWGWSPEQAKNVMNAISEIKGEELEDPASEMWDKDIHISDYSTGRNFSMTLRELDENPLRISSVPSGAIKTKDKGIPMVDPTSRGSSSAFQGRYTSDSVMGFKVWFEAVDDNFKQKIFKIPVYHVTSAEKLDVILKSGLKKGAWGEYGPAVYASVNFDERSFGTEPGSNSVVIQGELDITNFLIQGITAPNVCQKQLDVCVYGVAGIGKQIQNLYPEAPAEWKKEITINPTELSMYFRHDTRCPGMLIDHNGTVEGNWAVIYTPSRLVLKKWSNVNFGKLEWHDVSEVRGGGDERKADTFHLSKLRGKIKNNPYGSLSYTPPIKASRQEKPVAIDDKINLDIMDI